ncbi:M48 family metallopeptidase [Methanobacterium alcaliphilum]|uniref:M48 family metallopeptidase n=1 Tax=Methanobacterium alcaliphilum TaxID=392018 RepID=UPI00200AAA12|nr:M48 family metallopeptidase [Methanobacterium alcaliphilum]MCK9151823.1 M48 family metallopeptidase [Methanobacterium alcaliphilum]
MQRKKLLMLNPIEYEHKFDKKALNAVKKIPALKRFFQNELSHQESRENVRNMGSSVKVTPTHFSDIHDILIEACSNIHLNHIPEMYIGSYWMGGSGWDVNACTLGYDNPIILLSPGSVEYLTPDELLCVIGHEAGHIKSGHCLYHTMISSLSSIGSAITTLTLGLNEIIGDSLNQSIAETMNYWSRMSEFTADRAGLLACQDLDVAISVEMKLCGVPPKLYDKMDTNEFIKQAEEFENFESLEKYYKEIIELDYNHPWGVIRAFELLKWIESGRYNQILDIHTEGKLEELQRTCIKCGTKLNDDEEFCGCCGSKPEIGKCSKCGTELLGGESFCGVCGERLWIR